MSKATIVWLVIAISLVLLGTVIFGGALAIMGWDFTKLSTVNYVTNDYEIADSYNNISIVTNTADVVFEYCEGNETSVVCYEEEKAKHNVYVKDGTLYIEVVNSKKWYDHIGVDFGRPKITVSIPKGELGAFSLKINTGDVEIPKGFMFESIDVSGSTSDVVCCSSASGQVKIKTGTGDITVGSISAETLELTVSTGRISVSDVNCKGDINTKVSTGKSFLENITCADFMSSGNTGDMRLKNVIASGKFIIERSTGDIRFEKCDAAEICVTTDTGDVSGSLLSDKVFVVRSDTGDINVPSCVTGGKCEITTDTGDIEIEIG